MVPERYGKGGAHLLEKPQHFERFPAPVDQVAATPYVVFGGIKLDQLKQVLEGLITALDVSNQVGCQFS